MRKNSKTILKMYIKKKMKNFATNSTTKYPIVIRCITDG